MVSVLSTDKCLYFYRLGMVGYCLLFPFFPFLNPLFQWIPCLLWPCFILLMGLRQCINVFVFCVTAILVNDSAPQELLGTVHALCQMFSSLARSLGPALGGILYSWSLTNGLQYPFNHDFIFWFLDALAIITTLHAFVCMKPSSKSI